MRCMKGFVIKQEHCIRLDSYPMYGVIYTNYPPPPPMYDGTPGHAFETTGQQHRVHFVPKATPNSYTTPPYPNAPTAPPRSPPRY